METPPPPIISTPAPAEFNPKVPPPVKTCPMNFPSFRPPNYAPYGHAPYYQYGYDGSHNSFPQQAPAISAPYGHQIPPSFTPSVPPPIPQPPLSSSRGGIPPPYTILPTPNPSGSKSPPVPPAATQINSEPAMFPSYGPQPTPLQNYHGYSYPPPSQSGSYSLHTPTVPPTTFSYPPPPVPLRPRAHNPNSAGGRTNALIQIDLKKPPSHGLQTTAQTTTGRKQLTPFQDEKNHMKRTSSLPNLPHKSIRPDRNLTAPYGISASSRYRGRMQYKENEWNFEKPRRGNENNKETERDRLLRNWRSQYCETSEEMNRRLAELANNEEKEVWIRSSPAELYYNRTNNGNEVESTARLDSLCNLFEEKLIKRAERARANQVPYNPPPRTRKKRLCRHKSEKCSSSESSEEEYDPEEDCSMEELSKKIQHPYRLHPDLWHNEPGEMNDGPLCRCSAKSRRTGIRHGIYPGEQGFPKCKQNSNNPSKLYHYRITISPPTNFLTKTPTIIKYDQHEFLFEGFSLLSHAPIKELPTCKVIRFNIEYTILYIEEKMPENFTIQELDLFFNYLFYELLELLDFSILPSTNSNIVCPCFHFLPRFVRDLEDNGKEVLSMCEVLKYLLDSSGPLVDRETLERMMEMSQHEWQDYVDYVKGMVVTNPGRRPCSVRVDQLDRNVSDLPECIDITDAGIIHPVIVHFGIRPPQLSYAGNPEYQKAWKEYVKFRHLVANMSKPSYEDRRKLEWKEAKLQEMRTQGRMKRNVTVAVSSKGFYRTGIMCDLVQHAMLIPVLTGHLRFHHSLDLLEQSIEYKFQNRYLLQLALTHPSYKENFGTNPDHARNSLTNCGIRQPEYGDRKIHYMNTRKRGINTLINIMSRFGREYETDSNISHNERLEFLGDAVVEFISSIHLFFMFPDLEEGGLATYRAAIVQNQHLAVLAKKLHLDEFMLYAHGSDLCHELELRHAMANCFEALMGALLLDGGIPGADKVFAHALFIENETLKEVWENYPPHPLQEQEPLGDRKWIEPYKFLKNLTKFEESIGVQFKHIRLLARAFTDRSIGYTHLTLGSNQRMEFLGDTVLQLISSEYLYRHFPEHHEGHLSLLRSSLVNNRTQAVVCDDLGMTQYAQYSCPKAELKTKDRADLLEAFLGALYVDKGLDYCETFCQVCLFPRLQIFIMNQDWNDPKSKLQQCCLTLRTMDGGEPDIPVYKVIECKGPTNTRVYTVAVYFRGKRLASATGHSIQQAEMNSAKQALENARDLFPQLDHQKRVIAQSIKRQKGSNDILPDLRSDTEILSTSLTPKRQKAFDDLDESNLPKQYRMREDISSDELPPVSEEDSISAGASTTTDQDNRSSSKKKKHKKHKRKKKQQYDKNLRSSDSLAEEGSSGVQISSNIDNELSPLSDDEVHFIDEITSILKENGPDSDGKIGNNTKTMNKGNIKDQKTLSTSNQQFSGAGTYEKDVACFKIEGAEELSSDIESGEII